MKARFVYACGCEPTPEHPSKIRPVGEVIEHPDAYMLVRHGCAEPADEECAKAADVTPEQWQTAYEVYGRADAGIHPDDFWAWNKGLMRGYNPDGSWKPGPNSEDEADYLDVMEEDYDD